jgi:hypothetical protein
LVDPLSLQEQRALATRVLQWVDPSSLGSLIMDVGDRCTIEASSVRERRPGP